MVYPRFGSIIEQSPVVVPFSAHNTLSRILDRFLREIVKCGTMRVELCGVNTLFDATGGKLKSLAHIVSSDCGITNIF